MPIPNFNFEVKAGNVHAVSTLMGLTTVSLINVWQSVAPTLQDVRDAPPGDPMIAQRMLDANYLGVSLAVFIGGTTSFLVKSWVPVIMAVGSVYIVSEWHSWILNSQSTEEIANG